MAALTPMMQQYLKIKEQNPNALLFFRLGDFYEMFGEDAKTAAAELDLTLTTRDRGKSKEEQTPMCGVPYHSCEGYIARLIAKGYKVAICEQMEDPAKAKGLVERDIIRVVTPGTVIDSAMLEDGKSNYISGVFFDNTGAGVCFADISTGKTLATAFSGPERVQHVINELGRFCPAEVIMNAEAAQDHALNDFLRDRLNCHREQRPEEAFDATGAREAIVRQYGAQALDALPQSIDAVARALGGLLGYLYETQKTDLSYINALDYYEQGRFMELDPAARRNLELTETMRAKEKRGSLLWVLDKTKTPMGSRCLRGFLERPLLSPTAIQKRQNAVAALVDNTMAREELILALSGMGDMERLIGRIVYGTAGGRDLTALRAAIEKLPAVLAQLSQFPSGRLGELSREMDDLSDLAAKIAAAIDDDPPFSVREGKVIRPGYNAEVDRLRDILGGGKSTVVALESREKEKTGIRTLRVRLQPRVRLLHRGVQLLQGAGARLLYPQADPGQRRALCDRRTEGTGKHHPHRLGPGGRAGIRTVCRRAPGDLRRGGPHPENRRRDRRTGRLSVSGRRGRAQQLRLPHRGRKRRDRNSRWPPPRGGKGAQGRAVRAQRHLYGRKRRAHRHHHRPQHGR